MGSSRSHFLRIIVTSELEFDDEDLLIEIRRKRKIQNKDKETFLTVLFKHNVEQFG